MPCYKRQISHGERWFYKFNYKGVMYRSETIYSSKAEAKKFEAVAYQEAQEKFKDATYRKDVFLYEAIDERLTYIQVRKTDHYYRESKRYLRIFRNRLGNVILSDIRKPDIESLLVSESHKGFYTVNAMLRCFKALFNHAIENHDLNIKNPCKGMKFFPIEKRIKYIPSDQDIEDLLNVCDEHQRLLIEFLRDTGARLSEALKLKGKDINNDSVILYTKKSVNANLTPRAVPKPRCLVGVTFVAEKLVFDKWTEQPKFLPRKLKVLGQKQWGFHNLRHRYASHLSKNKTPLFEIMSLLGHSNLDTTQRYLQLIK